MAINEPDYLWLASGGLSQLSAKRMQFYKKRKVVFYPDLGAYEKWKQKAEKLNELGFTISTSTLLEEKATESDKSEGFDVADYFIQERLISLKPTENLAQMILKNPALQILIDTFQLKLIK
jgi:hypothetical protein